MIKIKYNHWGGVINESKVIDQLHDQWCRDNGYRIREQAGQYRHKYGRNVSKKRQKTDSVYVW